MNNQSILAKIAALLTVLILGCSADPFPHISIPVYPNHENLLNLVNKPAKGTKAVTYFVKTAFPASDIVSFYKNEFEKLGFEPYSDDGYGKQQWESFNYQSGEWEKTSEIPGRFISTWVDKNKDLRIILVMTNEYDASDALWKNKLFVSCTVSPFFDFRKVKPPSI